MLPAAENLPVNMYFGSVGPGKGTSGARSARRNFFQACRSTLFICWQARWSLCKAIRMGKVRHGGHGDVHELYVRLPRRQQLLWWEGDLFNNTNILGGHTTGHATKLGCLFALSRRALLAQGVR